MPDSINKRKAALRAQITNSIKAIEAEERHARSVEVCHRITRLECFRHASNVMMYMPLAAEVDILPLALRCFQMGMTVCVPRVDWQRKDMRAMEITSFDDQDMDVDEHGIRVPREGRLVHPSEIDVIIVPGIGFDTCGRRLGRGAGYYDRFLSRVSREATKVGVAFDEQVVDEIPFEPHDIRVDVIVTDRRVTRTDIPQNQH